MPKKGHTGRANRGSVTAGGDSTAQKSLASVVTESCDREWERFTRSGNLEPGTGGESKNPYGERLQDCIAKVRGQK